MNAAARVQEVVVHADGWLYQRSRRLAQLHGFCQQLVSRAEHWEHVEF